MVPVRMTAWASTRVPVPMTTPGSITENGPTETPIPRAASGATEARGWMTAWVTGGRSGLSVDDRREQLAFRAEGVVDAGFAAELPHIRAVVLHGHVEIESVARGDGVAELRPVDAEEEHQVQRGIK